MLTGADPGCGSLAEWPVRRAGKHKTLYVIIRKIPGEGSAAKLPLLNVEAGLRQPVYLPCLSAAAVPIDIGVTERS
jgi:hypothetical protein